MLQTCPRRAQMMPRHAPDMPQMMSQIIPQTCPRWCPTLQWLYSVHSVRCKAKMSRKRFLADWRCEAVVSARNCKEPGVGTLIIRTMAHLLSVHPKFWSFYAHGKLIFDRPVPELFVQLLETRLVGASPNNQTNKYFKWLKASNLLRFKRKTIATGETTRSSLLFTSF